jgi:hypothetical protein
MYGQAILANSNVGAYYRIAFGDLMHAMRSFDRDCFEPPPRIDDTSNAQQEIRYGAHTY